MHAKNHYQWNCGQAYIETNIQSSFRSKSLQRPSSKSYVPGAGTYTPNIHAVKAEEAVDERDFLLASVRRYSGESVSDFSPPIP